MLLGVHCSVSGGLHHAFDEAKELGIDTFQIFTRNQRQWTAKPISSEEKKDFENGRKHSGAKIIFSHASYLINLASAEPPLLKKSVDGIIDEVNRCHELGLAYTVLHPGAAKELSEEEALKKISGSLKTALNATRHASVKILLENTAGQGTTLGYKFEHLREIMDMVGSERIGTCFDTCHAFAAGYDIRTEKEFEKTMEKFDNTIGLKNLFAIHLNDSKGELGSRLDRHDHIGQGKIGLMPFRLIMHRFQKIPKVIETPKDEMDKVNLKVLRGFVK